MWTFTIFKEIKKTELRRDGVLVSDDCYSGNLEHGGFNNPEMSNIKDIGPLPEGMYIIEGPPYTDHKRGPYVLRLDPYSINEMFGRAGFLIHGKPLPPADINSGSDGCICADHDIRVKIWQSGDIILQCIYS